MIRPSLVIAVTLTMWLAPAHGALVDAIERVESGGKHDAVGDSGRAVGCLQIHRITVDEANRILGRKAYAYADRRSRAKSREMFAVVTGQWRGASDDVIARRWNGGPRGERKAATKRYWLKVKKHMQEAK